MNYDEIYQQFVGKDKIQPLEILKTENGSFKLRYKEGAKTNDIECEDRNTLEQILIEFGGKNPETCKADSKFLELDNKWSSEDLNELGHRITKIRVTGTKVVRSDTIPIEFPKETGHVSSIQSNRTQKDSLNKIVKDREDATFTRSFTERSEFDAMLDFLFSHSLLKGFTWSVNYLGTESRETSQQLVWQRVTAGDGTKRMVLELRMLDGKDFTECVRHELFMAAGDMFDAPCKRVSLKKKKQTDREICFFAAEDGSIDISGYEAASA